MKSSVARMRMFAGPNGSGKSELKKYLPPALLGIYLNPDEIEKVIRSRGFLNLQDYEVSSSSMEVLKFFRESSFLHAAGLAEETQRLKCDEGGMVDFSHVEVNSYFASVVVDFLRQKLLTQKASFTFETVMSHQGKVDLLRQAQEQGYRTYLYFIATDDPSINQSRVRNRVMRGGHSVPEQKIEERYYRSLDLLISAIRHTNRAYVFDNSSEGVDHTWLAEITDGCQLELKTDKIPAWFHHSVLEKTA